MSEEMAEAAQMRTVLVAGDENVIVVFCSLKTNTSCVNNGIIFNVVNKCRDFEILKVLGTGVVCVIVLKTFLLRYLPADVLVHISNTYHIVAQLLQINIVISLQIRSQILHITLKYFLMFISKTGVNKSSETLGNTFCRVFQNCRSLPESSCYYSILKTILVLGETHSEPVTSQRESNGKYFSVYFSAIFLVNIFYRFKNVLVLSTPNCDRR